MRSGASAGSLVLSSSGGAAPGSDNPLCGTSQSLSKDHAGLRPVGLKL